MSKEKNTQKFYMWEGERETQVRPVKFCTVSSEYMAVEWVKTDSRGKELESGLVLDNESKPAKWSAVKNLLKTKAKV